MDIFQKINLSIKKFGLIESGQKIIIGLSGGPDSVFLFHLFLSLQEQYNLTLIAAHLNHEWRAEADQEEEMCRALSRKHNIHFVSTKISSLVTTIKKKYEGSKEEYARNMRRAFLEQVLKDHNGDVIALGHHAQDQQETFFIRLIRGTSLAGLTGMEPKQSFYIRPLLEINKADILDWLHYHGIEYAVDLSNQSLDYLRNRVRAKVIPALEECDIRWNNNFLTTITRLKQDNELLNQVVLDFYNQMIEKHNDAPILQVTLLKTIHPSLQYRIIVMWLVQNQVKFPSTQAFLDEIVRFLVSDRGGKHSISTHWSLVKKHNKVSIKKL